MSERAVRIVLVVVLSALAGIGILQFTMAAWPDPSVFTPAQAAFVLGSMMLWWVTVIGGIRAVVGGVKEP